MNVRLEDLPCWCWIKDHPLIIWLIQNFHSVHFIASIMLLGIVIFVGYIARKRTLELQAHLRGVADQVEKTYGELNTIHNKIKELHPDDYET